ncbi:MAG: hypothetical protein US71_C0019G0008 [Parcubacteria group bacterium GW2011_GWD2_38_12]|nr:MAG: hypothetical protein US71_C0019G0008 [Parcubacteria group bacterium GW2011_GWD2_38_12]
MNWGHNIIILLSQEPIIFSSQFLVLLLSGYEIWPRPRPQAIYALCAVPYELITTS